MNSQTATADEWESALELHEQMAKPRWADITDTLDTACPRRPDEELIDNAGMPETVDAGGAEILQIPSGHRNQHRKQGGRYGRRWDTSDAHPSVYSKPDEAAFPGYSIKLGLALPTQEDYVPVPLDPSMVPPMCWPSNAPASYTSWAPFPAQPVGNNIGQDEHWNEKMVEDNMLFPWMQLSGLNMWPYEQQCDASPFIQHFVGAPHVTPIQRRAIPRDAHGAAGESGNGRAPQSYEQWCAAKASAGSVGHPYACAEACKYVKKPRGCKDGTACDRCHLCEWKKNSTYG